MIARPAPSAHVCLRCQLQLSKQLKRNNTVSASLGRRPEQVRQLHNEGVTEDQDGIRVRRIETVLRSGAGTTYRKLRSIGANRLSKRPMGKVHEYQGHLLREKHHPLNVETLGRTSEVIVLREAGLAFRARRDIQQMKAEPVDILAQIDAERGLPSQAEVNHNIDEIRPKAQVVGSEDFKSLEQQLNDGFKTSQLVDYIDSFETKREEDSKLPSQDLPIHALWTLGWMPGVSTSSGVFDEDPLRGYISAAHTPKQRLVLRVIRQCWNIEVLELVDSLGEIELHINALELELLIKGRLPPLRTLSNTLISTQDEKIEAIRSRSVIRITAAKEKAYTIVQEIQNLLKNFRHEEVDLAPLLSLSKTNIAHFGRDGFNDAAIARLAQLTDTNMKLLPDNKLEITYINQEPDTNVSNQFDTARRLLLLIYDNPHNVSRQQRLGSDTLPIKVIKHETTGNMSWLDRLTSWGRWAAPVNKAGDRVNNIPQNSKEAKDDTKSTRYKTLQNENISLTSQKDLCDESVTETAPTSGGYAYWDRKFFTVTSVVVGQVLHRIDPNAPVTTSLSKDAAPDGIFIPFVTNLSKLLTMQRVHNNIPSHGRTWTSVIMSFRPSPWTAVGAEACKRFPEIEVRFVVHPETQNLEVKDIFALDQASTMDVMIPDYNLDLRFQQRTTSRLRQLHNQTFPQITDFLRKSQLNITRGPLQTPPGLTLPIAPHLHSPRLPGTETPTDVEYLLSGIAYRTTLATTFKKWTLLYTSIDEGLGQGRRAELSLRPRPAGKKMRQMQQTINQESLTQDYIDAAHSLLKVLNNDELAIVKTVQSSPEQSDIGEIGLGPIPTSSTNIMPEYFQKPVTFSASPGEDGEDLTTSRVQGMNEGEQQELELDLDEEIDEVAEDDLPEAGIKNSNTK